MLKLKAYERRNPADPENDNDWRYSLVPELYSRIEAPKVLEEAALRSGLTRGAIQAAWDAIGEVIVAWTTEGHSVAIPGLGSMRYGVRCSSKKLEDVSSSMIKTRRVIFTPSTEIKKSLQGVEVSITCYDRNGNLVKRVTSQDDGNVETEPDNGSTGDGSDGGDFGV